MVSVPTSAALHSTPVQRNLLGNQIADALRKDVIFGVLKPGTRVSQQQLCEQFGTSRMPVRDGLRMLVQEGLMQLDNARHIVVSPLNRDDILDSFQIEAMLTGLAAERASERATEAELAQLEQHHKGMLDASRSGRQDEMVDLNWRFHRQINHMAGSRKLIVALRKVSFDLPRDYLEQLPEWNSKSNKEHASIIKAMRAGDHAAARSRMADHVEESGRGLVNFLESQGVELD